MGKTRASIWVYSCKGTLLSTDGPWLLVIELGVICVAMKLIKSILAKRRSTELLGWIDDLDVDFF